MQGDRVTIAANGSFDMRNHVYTTFGLIMLGIFLWRGMRALAEPGIGLPELYILGGFALSIALVVTGIRGLLASRKAASPDASDAGGAADR